MNLQKIAEYLQATFAHLPPPGQEVVLFLGVTGSGKSTLVNYLLGNRLIRWDRKQHRARVGRLQGGVYLEKDDPNAPQIGDHGANSCTRGVRLYQSQREGDCWSFCDSAGLQDPDEDQRLVNLLALERAVTRARGIKLVVVIKYAEIEAEKGKVFREMAKELAELLKYFFPKDTQASLDFLFLVNDAPKEKNLEETDVILLVQQQMERLLQEATHSSSVSTASEATNREICRFSVLLGALMVKPERMILVDPLDVGETREMIFSQLRRMRTVSSGLFQFDTGLKWTFMTKLTESCALYLEKLQRHRNLCELKDLAADNRACFGKYGSGLEDVEIRSFAREDIADFSKKINVHQTKLRQLSDALQRSTTECEKLDISAPMVFDTHVVSPDSWRNVAVNMGDIPVMTGGSMLGTILGGILVVAAEQVTGVNKLEGAGAVAAVLTFIAGSAAGGTVAYQGFEALFTSSDIQYRYEGIQYLRVGVEERRNGRLRILRDSPATGEYRAVFEYQDRGAAVLNLSIWGETRHFPENAQKIRQLRSSRITTQNEMDQIKHRMDNTHRIIKILQDLDEGNIGVKDLENSLSQQTHFLQDLGSLYAELGAAKEMLAILNHITQHVLVEGVSDVYRTEYRQWQVRNGVVNPLPQGAVIFGLPQPAALPQVDHQYST